jgi:hypothetical protein
LLPFISPVSSVHERPLLMKAAIRPKQLASTPQLPHLIGQSLVNEKGFDVDIGEHGEIVIPA